MAVILCFTRLQTIILCSPPLLWQTAGASAEMISNRFSKMLSARLLPYIISFQWSENKNLIHKSIAVSIGCTFYFAPSRFYIDCVLFLRFTYKWSLPGGLAGAPIYMSATEADSTCKYWACDPILSKCGMSGYCLPVTAHHGSMVNGVHPRSRHIPWICFQRLRLCCV